MTGAERRTTTSIRHWRTLFAGIFLASGAACGPSDPTSGFTIAGSYVGDVVVTTSGAGDALGDAIVSPDTTLRYDDDAKQLTLGPDCIVALTLASTESYDDRGDVRELAYTFTPKANQTCVVPTETVTRSYVLGAGTLRFTRDGNLTVSLGGDAGGIAMAYQFDGLRQ